VLIPFASPQSLVFAQQRGARLVSCHLAGLSLRKTLPVISVLLSFTKLEPVQSLLIYSLRLWPASLTGYDFLHESCRSTVFTLRPRTIAPVAFSTPCRGKFELSVTAQPRPQPIHLKGQLMNQPPFRSIDEESYLSYLCRKTINQSHDSFPRSGNPHTVSGRIVCAGGGAFDHPGHESWVMATGYHVSGMSYGLSDFAFF
jgi:hypothetical protein